MGIRALCKLNWASCTGMYLSRATDNERCGLHLCGKQRLHWQGCVTFQTNYSSTALPRVR